MNMIDFYSVVMAVFLHVVLLMPVIWNGVSAIDCYQCYSFNKSDTYCGDPFHPAYGHLVKDCTQAKDGHHGEFRAKFCIKLIGTTVEDNIEMVFRGCSLKTLDSQCGDFKYEDVRYRGCVMSCTEDNCNAASGLRAHVQLLTSFVIGGFALRLALRGGIHL